MVKFKRLAPQLVVPDVVSTAEDYRDVKDCNGFRLVFAE